MDLHILAFFNNRRCLITILHRLCSKQCMENIPTLLSHTRLTNLTPVIQLMTKNNVKGVRRLSCITLFMICYFENFELFWIKSFGSKWIYLNISKFQICRFTVRFHEFIASATFTFWLTYTKLSRGFFSGDQITCT